MKQESGKRIVSKGEYVIKTAKKVALSSSGLSLYLLGLLGVTALLVLLCLTRLEFLSPSDYALVAGFVLASAVAFYIGRRTLRKGIKVETGVPLTRANTANLLPPDILVRSSQEPLQAQEMTLLRAVAEASEKYPEQLLRAAVGKQERVLPQETILRRIATETTETHEEQLLRASVGEE